MTRFARKGPLGSRMVGRVRPRWNMIAMVAVVGLAATLGNVIDPGHEAPTIVVDESSADDDCSAMASYTTNRNLSTNGASTSGIYDSPMTVVAHERRLAREDVEKFKQEAAAAASTPERQQAEAHRLMEQAKIELFDVILAGDAHMAEEPGKVTFSMDSPEAWFEITEDSEYWYPSGLYVTGLPPAACV